MSEVARREKLRVAPLVEIRPGEVTTAAPSTIQVTAVCVGVSTDVLRVKTHVRLSVVPAYRVSVLLTVMDGVGTGTGEIKVIKMIANQPKSEMTDDQNL